MSIRSTHSPTHDATVSVLCKSSEGAWPVIAAVAEAIDREWG